MRLGDYFSICSSFPSKLSFVHYLRYLKPPTGFLVLLGIARDDRAVTHVENVPMGSADDVICRPAGDSCACLAVAIHGLRQVSVFPSDLRQDMIVAEECSGFGKLYCFLYHDIGITEF
jgi:hypothetical protein